MNLIKTQNLYKTSSIIHKLNNIILICKICLCFKSGCTQSSQFNPGLRLSVSRTAPRGNLINVAKLTISKQETSCYIHRAQKKKNRKMHILNIKHKIYFRTDK